jgi:hypothetical protein
LKPEVRELLLNAEANMIHAFLTGRITVATYREHLKETERNLQSDEHRELRIVYDEPRALRDV